MKESTYARVTKLAGQLQKGKVTERRKHGQMLLDLLTKKEMRRKIALEAAPSHAGADEPSVSATQCHALSQLWTVTLVAAIGSVQSFQTGKAKLSAADIQLPFKLLIACDEPDEVFDNAGLAIPKLSKKTIRTVLNYCLNMLNDDKAIELCELDLLRMLKHMCSRRAYVGYFTTKTFIPILGELSERLCVSVEEDSPLIFLQAAEVLDSLFRTCRTLGIQMNSFISGVLEIIAEWCKNHVHSESIRIAAIGHFYNTVASILFSHPESSIGPMKRYGRPILSYCKRCYSATNAVERDALNNYILANLFVSQVAGEIHGYVAGDVGNLGRASLNHRHINDLLDLVMRDVGKVIGGGDENKRKRDFQLKWTALELKQRRHLEAAARLMAIAQRKYLAQAELTLMGDNVEEGLSKYLMTREDGTDEWVDPKLRGEDRCPLDAFVESPFIRHVAQKLCRCNSSESQNTGGSMSQLDTPTDFPILNRIREKAATPMDSQIGYLSVVCACAEVFPAGECWTSAIGIASWRSLASPSKSSSEDPAIHYHTSSPDDLGLLVSLLGEMLEANGGPGGDVPLQSWILVTLISLTESFAAHFLKVEDNTLAFGLVGSTWRHIWGTLLRSDLRYHAYTEASSTNSLGDLVLTLLTKMINMKCTDPLMSIPGIVPTKRSSFIYENQPQIWALPVFKDFQAFSSAVPLMLICSVLAVAGLSDVGGDKIDASLSKTLFPRDQTMSNGSRRKRLLCLAFGCLQQWAPFYAVNNDDAKSEQCSFPALVVLALVHGATAIRVNNVLTLWSKTSDSSRFQCTTLPVWEQSSAFMEANEEAGSGFQDASFLRLWGSRSPQQHCTSVEESRRQLDMPWVVADIIRGQVDYLYRSPERADFIPDSESNELSNAARAWLEEYIASPESEHDDGSASATTPSDLSELRKEVTSLQAMAMKFKLSLNLFCSDQRQRDELRVAANEALKFLSEASTKLCNISDSSEFCKVVSDLLRIAEALLELSPFVKVSADIVGETVERFKAMLLNYFSRNRQVKLTNIDVEGAGVKGRSEGSLWSDEDEDIVSSSLSYPPPRTTSFDDSEDEASRKRKRSLSFDGSHRSQKRGARDLGASVATPPDLESAQQIGSILMALDPSVATCALICQSLLGTELSFDPSDINGDLNLNVSMHCLHILSSNSPVFHSKAKELLFDAIASDRGNSRRSNNCSVISTFSTVLDLIRTCAGPTSPLYCKGYWECARVVLAMRTAGSLTVTEDEILRLVAFLKSEDGIQSRPWLRAERIGAATKAFMAGDDRFHRAFDKTFPNSFVKCALQDPNFVVRRKASVAVGFAMRFLDEKKIVQSVLRLIPPVTEKLEGEIATDAFCNWYNEVGYAHAVDASSKVEIHDAAEVMESDTILCRSIIAGSAKSISLFHKTLFDLLMIPTIRQDLEFTCFRALGSIAYMKDYCNVEEMIRCESEGLLKLWVESDFAELPLALTAPNILQRMMICEMYSAGKRRDLDELRRRASDIFVSRYRHVLLPMLLLNSLSAQMPYATNDSAAILRYLAEEPKLQAICEIVSGNEVPADVIRKMLRHHIADIHAFVSPILSSEVSKHHNVAKNVPTVLESILTARVVQERVQKKTHLIIRRIFELSGSAFGDVLPAETSVYFRAIIRLVDLDPQPKGLTGDILLRAGTNATENLIRAFVRLDRSNLSLRRRCCWSEIQLQCKFIEWQIQCNQMDDIQLGFCIHILTEAMLKRNLALLRPDILSLLKNLLNEALVNMSESQLKIEVTPVIQRLVGACIVVHEARQQELLSTCRAKALDLKRRTLQSCGLLATCGNGYGVDAWGWETIDVDQEMGETATRALLEQQSHIVDNDVRNNITGTFDVLQQIFQNADSLALKPQHFLSTAPPYAIVSTDLSALAAFNEKFCAQNLALLFIQQQGHSWDDLIPDIQTLVHGLKVRLNDTHSWVKSARSKKNKKLMATERMSVGSLNVDQRLLYAELKQLERKLRDSKLNEVPAKDLEDLIKQFCYICGSSCPDEIRFAASRCLGELNPKKLAKLCHTESSPQAVDVFEAVIEQGDLLLMLKSTCMESLGASLKSPDPNIALVAANTLSSLLSTEIGRKCWTLLNGHVCRKALSPFANSQGKFNRGCGGLLTRHEVNILKAKVSDEMAENGMWCWDRKLWECWDQRESAFQEWIRTVTCAIILCCFKNQDKEARSFNEDCDFFWRCQKMVLLDHGFASIVFQCMVLRLLDKRPPSMAFNFNRALSESFTVLMDCKDQDVPRRSTRANIKALSLAIDTLHLLCRVSLRRFASLPHHQNRSKREKLSSKQAYNDSLPPPLSWQGLPFGVTLKLDGMLVARACMQARRYASGLFFLELHFDSRFGKSGGILEELATFGSNSNYENGSDISGDISTKRNGSGEQNDEGSTASALAAMELSALCLHALDEREALDAIETQMSALNFFEVGSTCHSTLIGRKASLETLRNLSTRSVSADHPQGLPLQVSDCLAELGCHQMVLPYIEGVLSRHEKLQELTNDTIDSLKEKWYETELRNHRWDVLLKPECTFLESTPVSQTSVPLTIPQNIDEAAATSRSSSTHLYSNNSLHGKTHGFFQSIVQALGAFQDEDVELCQDLLVQGRSALLEGVARAGFGESPILGVARVVDRLRALRDIDFVVSKMKRVEELEDIWEVHSNPAEETVYLGQHIGFFNADDQKSSRSLGALEIDIQSFSSGIREMLLRALCKKQNVCLKDNRPFKMLLSHLWETAVRTREAGRPNIAEASLQRLHSIFRTQNAGLEGIVDKKLQLRIRIEEARLAECRGDFSSAIRTLKQVVDFLKSKENNGKELDSETSRLLTDAQISCGTWMTKYKIQQAKVVLETYLQPGAERARVIFDRKQSPENTERSTHASLEFGQIVSNLYEALSSRVKSLEWKQASIALSHQEKEFDRAKQLREDAQGKLKNASKKTKMYADNYNQWVELHHFCETLRKDIEASTKERKKILGSMRAYLTLAIQSFITALSMANTGIKADMSKHVFRLISLWFNNARDSSLDESVNGLMSGGIEKIPTYRFLPLTYQLVSRVESKESENVGEFQPTLQRLIFKMCVDHPYHLMVPIIALSNGNKVENVRHTSDFLENVGDKKVSAAADIIDRLHKDAPIFIGDMLQSYIALTQSYIQLAHAPTTDLHKKTTKRIRFSQVASIGATGRSKVPALDICLRNADSPPCILTAPPPIRPGADYGEGADDPVGGERVLRFESTFDITETGIHRPKIVVCIGSRGGRFRQLVKGEDDLRQDAIMNQVFSYVNGLMMRRGDGFASKVSSSCFQKGLKMVTYNVSPLSPMSGVLEWVENTIPFGNYEEDKRGSKSVKTAGAHSRYYAGEWGNQLCRIHLGESPSDEKRRSFDEICRRHSPVFRFFFIERFGHCLQAWHAAKMNFTRSVAMSSIVGHILGIGDRHCKNILVHEKTGTVVHIDFGIVFEQGKLLTTPERVPFRLTRNLIDGMGPSGVEGTFIGSAEETTRVLRNNSDALLTILSAVVNDPLYKWSLSPVEARKRQKDCEANDEKVITDVGGVAGLTTDLGSSEAQNKAAAKAVAKIKAKLQGYEDWTSGEQHGILGQVLLLVNSARDPDNLCAMFPGWSPWI